MERSNQQTSDIPSSNKATAMRAGVQNPSGSNYQVAGPTIGGTATPYNPDNIEVAKDHLADSFATKASINDTSSAKDSTLKDTVVSGASTAAHTAVDVTKTVAAGAALAGAATVMAVKSLFADKGTHATTDSTGMHPATTVPHTTTTTTPHTSTTTSKVQPIADFPNTQVHNLHSDTSTITPTHTHAATGLTNPVSIQEFVEPTHSTGLHDTLTASSGPKTDYRAKEADLHATSSGPASKADLHPTSKLDQGYNTHHSFTPAADSIDSRPLTEKNTTPALGTAAAGGAAAAGTAAYLGHKASERGSEAKDTSRNTSLGTPSSTTPYATMDSTEGIHNPSLSDSTRSSSYTPLAPATLPIQSQGIHTHPTTNTSSAPLTEKVKAPLFGAAALGATTAGTAAYLGNKSKEDKESKETVNPMTTSNQTPAVDSMDTSNQTHLHNLHSHTNPIISTHTHAATGLINPVPIQEIVEPIHSTGLDDTLAASSGPKTDYRAKDDTLAASSGLKTDYRAKDDTLAAPSGFKTDYRAKDDTLAASSGLKTDYRAKNDTLAASSGPKTDYRAKDDTLAASSGLKTDYRAKEADLHAASGVPASKVDVQPTTKINQGYNTHYSSTPAADSFDSRPLTEKNTTPALGTAAAGGAAAAGTAAYLGHKASERGSEAKDTSHNTSSGTPSSTASYATMDSTKGIYNPSLSDSTHSSSYAPLAPATLPIQSHDTHTHPTTNKAPLFGAAALGTTAAGTAAYLGNKSSGDKESKETVNPYSSSTPGDAPLDKSTGYMATAQPAAQHPMAESMNKTATSATNPFSKAEEIKASSITPATDPAIVRSTPLDTFHTASHVDSPTGINTSSSRPMTEKSTAPLVGASAVGAAAAGTAAYLGNRASETKNTTHDMSTPSNTSTSYNPTNTNTLTSSSYNPANTNINTHTSSSYPSSTTTAPIMAAASLPKMATNTSTTQQHLPSTTASEMEATDTTAGGIPASYHGTVPKAGPGEEVKWVKTVTTTDYYDDGTSTGRADVVDRHQEAIDPSAYATVKDGQTVYNSDDQQHQQHNQQEYDPNRQL
ncbi:hypothetical protein BGZ96_000136 [Linnemannia gamsii]|uniref:Uncharacterized protein n=1 Tax=Linnemannia gamsii TaxID=64522 RepID=A0ABQ7JPP8_9FUNG|nr:hypothetical protein BGZ96_000136 [Linnemannia gamsii]